MTTVPAEECDADLRLVEGLRSGDRRAFGEFLRRQDEWVRGVIYATVGRSDGLDDVAQQVWSSVWQRAHELRDSRAWRAWLFRLTRNAAFDAGRQLSRRRKLALSLAETAATERAHGVGTGPADDRDAQQAVRSAIESLPAHYREPFVLRHLSGWTYKQIAEVMQMPVDSIETRLVRARRLLREALKDVLA